MLWMISRISTLPLVLKGGDDEEKSKNLILCLVFKEALDKLREQTREAVKGLAPMSKLGGYDLSKDAMMEDWFKQFEELAGSQILHGPMKEIEERYPQWLDEHKTSLSKEEHERYSLQYELIKELNGVYENDPHNFTWIVDLMQKMQECGQPPNDILQDLAPEFGLWNLD
ncbi:hypothetical protein GOBAR_DD25467 [Gossypium barbadense]|nr:hypothetical protein GOBAR_DD25467 [Gossypium barbadense]